MYGPPQPQTQPQQIDINAALAGFTRRVPAGDMLIALCLLLLFSFSFVGSWFQVSAATAANCSPSVTTVCGFSNDSLWHGFGILPAVLIIVAIVFFVIRRLRGVRLVLGVPEAVVWMGFCVLEIGLFFAYWVIGNGSALVDYCELLRRIRGQLPGRILQLQHDHRPPVLALLLALPRLDPMGCHGLGHTPRPGRVRPGLRAERRGGREAYCT